MLGPPMGDPSGLPPSHIAGLPQSHIPGLPSSNPIQPTLQAPQHWQNPNTAGKSSQDQNQSNQTSNVDTSQAMLSPAYPAGGRHPLASTSSPPSRARTQEVPGGGSRGLPGGGIGSQSDMEDDGQSTGSRLPSGKHCTSSTMVLIVCMCQFCAAAGFCSSCKIVLAAHFVLNAWHCSGCSLYPGGPG